MPFKNIELINFRNFKNESTQLENGVNIFYGMNAQGKTNLLESLYFIARGKSFRTLSLDHFLREDEEDGLNQNLKLIIKTDFRDSHDVNNKLKVEIFENKKNFWLNQKKTFAHKILGLCPVVLFSPESLSVIKNGPSERRNIIDDLIESLPEFSKSVQNFKKILKARNKVFQDLKKNIKKDQDVKLTLEALNEIFLKNCLDLVELRFYFLERMRPFANEAVKYIFGEKNEFDFRYIASETHFPSFIQEEWRLKLLSDFKRLYDAEKATGHSLVGPHKNEIRFVLNGKDSRYYCSQGQQRGLIISLKIAEILYRISMRNEKPVLLLDDVMSELDEGKRIKLVDFLKSINSQIIITTTDKTADLEKSMGPHAQFKIEDGKIISL